MVKVPQGTAAKAAASVVAAALVFGGGAAVMATVAGAEGRPAAEDARPDARAVLGRSVHGDLIVQGRDGAFHNVTVDRGKLASVNGKTLTIERADGKSVTATIVDATRFRGVSGASELKSGAPTLLVSRDGVLAVVGQRRDGARRGDRADRPDRAQRRAQRGAAPASSEAEPEHEVFDL